MGIEAGMRWVVEGAGAGSFSLGLMTSNIGGAKDYPIG